mgnify:CR=1 FL=1
MSEEIKKGLLGIVVDETTISHVVPELSTLTYRGYTCLLYTSDAADEV